MLEELRKVPGGAEAMPFVLMFCGSSSVYLWEDDCGVVHRIHQGEGGEQGDPLMPLLFALGQHPALVAAQTRLESDMLMAFLDDVYIVSFQEPDHVGNGFAGKPKCGTGGECVRKCATFSSSRWHESPTPAPGCGEDRTGQRTSCV